MRQLPGFQDGRDQRRGVPLISHHLVPNAAHPGLEQLALRGFPGAIGSFESHQETAALVLPAEEFAESPLFRRIGGLKGHVYTEYTLQSEEIGLWHDKLAWQHRSRTGPGNSGDRATAR